MTTQRYNPSQHQEYQRTETAMVIWELHCLEPFDVLQQFEQDKGKDYARLIVRHLVPNTVTAYEHITAQSEYHGFETIISCIVSNYLRLHELDTCTTCSTLKPDPMNVLCQHVKAELKLMGHKRETNHENH